ncbi:MAG: sulfatase-like hydrolase/transferase [Bacteroidota bacterium]
MKKLLAISILSLLFACEAKQEVKEAPPNILFLFADDLSYEAVSALGNSTIETPNLDRIAARGATFTHAYNMGGWHGAICAASRTMLMSGRSLWPAWEAEQAFRKKDSTVMSQTWGRIMARNGYDTYMSGKWHIVAPADYVFDEARHIRPGMPRDTWPAFRRNEGKMLTEKNGNDLDLKSLMPVGYHRPNDENDKSWSPADTSFGGFWQGGKHWSEVLKDDGLDYIESATKKDKPFFMYLAFNAPHDPRQAPQAFVDKYPLDKIKLPDNFMPLYPEKDSIGCSPGLRDEALAPFPRTEYAVKTHIQEYYAIITHLDEQIGKILGALEASGKMDNTYIFFSADHGLSVGKHGLIGKQNMYDHSVRVPLMIAGPDIPAGTKVSEDVYLQDLMATGLEVAGIEKPEYVYFKSLLGMAKGTQTEGHLDAVYGAYRDLQRMIRKDGFKLLIYPKAKKLKLFDLNEDPKEITNLATDPVYLERMANMFLELMDLQTQMKDTLDLSPLYNETI